MFNLSNHFTAVRVTITLLGLLSSCSDAFVHASHGNGNGNAFRVNGQPERYDAGLFAPLGDLGLVSTSAFTTLEHPAFSNYNVRIKRSTDFCDGTVAAYTGYIDIEARHIFFYFFESRNDPSTDDVIFWTTGGPGCSSSWGLFLEQGPCRITQPNATVYHPYSWNENANLFFVDQPVDVGFSYADYGEFVSTTEEAAKDIAAFVAIFFEHFSQFKGRAFHMAGSSYGGRYIPAFASYIWDQNAKLAQAGITPINISSIMIGNGYSESLSMKLSYYDMQCTSYAVPPIQSVEACVAMKRMLPRCEKWFKESCIDTFDAINCRAADNFCSGVTKEPFFATGYNPYDITKICDGPYEETLCYPIIKMIDKYLSQPSIRTLLGVDPVVPEKFSGCSHSVDYNFDRTLDITFPSQHYIAALLERGVRALVYVGANDWICNWIGVERMTFAMEWTGQDAYNSQPAREWSVDGVPAGFTRSTGPLTFTTIYGAGHMVSHDQPVVSLELVKRWLANEEL